MMDLTALFKLSYGMYAVTVDGERPTGCIANAVMQITAEPPRIAVSMNRENYTHRCMKEVGRFAVTVFSERADAETIGMLGFRSGRDGAKFAGVPFSERYGYPVPDGGCAVLTCRLIDSMDAGTHTIFLGEVTAAETLNADAPMTYAYYRANLRGRAPKNAPTWQREQKPPHA